MLASEPTAGDVLRLLADPVVHSLMRHRLGSVDRVDAIADRSPVYAVGASAGDFIVRLPADASSLALLRKEEIVQRQLRFRVALRLPDTEVVAPPEGSGLPCFAIHRRIPGRGLDDVELGGMAAAVRARLVGDLAAFFGQTHAVPLADACAWLGLEYAGASGMSGLAALYGRPAWFGREAAAAMSNVLEPHLAPAVLDVLADTAARFDALPCEPELMVFGHGDLHGGNMAVIDDGTGPRLMGVFDLGNAGVMDVHEDLFRLALVDERLLEETVARYQELSGRARRIGPERLEVYYRAFLFYLMDEGVRSGDAVYTDHMRSMIAKHLAQRA